MVKKMLARVGERMWGDADNDDECTMMRAIRASGSR
jgi:hypothetical protein